MKIIAEILSIVILLAGMASCAKTDRIYGNPQKEIAMNPVMHSMTKAEVPGPVTGSQYPDAEHFGVIAYYSPLFTDGQKWTSLTSVQPYFEYREFAKEGDTFSGSPKCYWPHQGSLVFAGYSPFDAEKESVTFDPVEKTLTITGFESDGQTDLMYFLPTLSNSGNYVGTLDKSNSVSAQFFHTLSLISFEIKADPLDDGKVTLKTVTLKNANTKGDFSATCVSSSSAGTLSWKNQITSEYPVASSSLPTVLSSSSALATQDLFVPGSNLTNSPVVEFKYEIAYNTVDGSGNVVNATKEETTSFTIEDYTAEWEAGKKYVYAVTIGLNRIEFENLTAEWR